MTILRASDVFRTAALDLGGIPTAKFAAVRGVMDGMGEAFAAEWRGNARETSGTHGKHYPDSIDSERRLSLDGVSVEVGPNRAKRQGGMGLGFEFGSENQPPHLDGLRAMDSMAVRVERALDAAMGF